MIVALFDWTSTKSYRALLITFVVFTLLDSLVTAVGIRVGCIELNPVVMSMGIRVWALFRLLLLGGMTTTFFAGYRLCSRYYRKGVRMLQTTLLVLDVFIVAVVSFGLLAILLRIM